jgi:hypothetical protein
MNDEDLTVPYDPDIVLLDRPVHDADPLVEEVVEYDDDGLTTQIVLLDIVRIEDVETA